MKIYRGDVGTQIVIYMAANIVSATNLSIDVRKPSGITETWTPTIFENDKLKYVIQNGDLDESGIYSVQPKMTLSGWTGSGAALSFRVDKTVAE